MTSPAHAWVIEDQYIDLLDQLQPILRKRPFLFGDRPCEADIGLQGPMFPHFANDPTSQEIMQARAPHVRGDGHTGTGGRLPARDAEHHRRVRQKSLATAEFKGEGSSWLPIYFSYHRAR